MGNEMFIFCFSESPTTGWDACKVKKLLHCLIICIYFYLTCTTTPKQLAQQFIFPKPLLCMTLICSDWSHFLFIMPVMPDKQRAQCCFVYSVTGKRYFTASKVAPSGKEWMHFHSDQRENTNKWANMLMLHVDVNMKRFGIRFKN